MNYAMSNQTHNGPVVVTGLKKAFGSQIVLDGLQLSVAEGETVAILGRSGSGKSVLLRLLIGLLAPDGGSIRILGQEITGLELEDLNEIRKKMGFLFQQAALYDSMTVGENVDFPMSRHTKLSRAERKARVHKLLSSVGMEHDIDKMPAEISGGMQKRVGLTRALALDPDILLLDEPTAGLDPITAREIARLIVDLKQKRAITSVVVTHDIHTARVFSDRLVVMQNGNILAAGSFQELQRSQDAFVAQFLGEAA